MIKKILVALSIVFMFASISYGSVIDQINQTFKQLGIKGYAQEEHNMIYLRGNYINEQQFAKAYHIAQVIAGINSINPGYDPLYTNILDRNLEECVAAGITGNSSLCPSPLPTINNLASSNEKSGKYALVISVGSFKYVQPALGQAPFNDAYLVSTTLKNDGYSVIELPQPPSNILKTNINNHTIQELSKRVTLQNVKQTIKNLLSKMPSGSTFVIYVSSHGTGASVNGDSGMVMYDTTESGPGCQYQKQNSKYYKTNSNTVAQQNTSNISSRSITLTTESHANELCNLVNTSLRVGEIIDMVEASHKEINLIIIPDVCYSGSLFGKHETYATKSGVANQIAGTYSNPILFVGAAQGNQESMQKPIDGAEHGIFTYYYFHYLPKSDYNAAKSLSVSKQIIQNESKNACLNGGGQGCATDGQTPFMTPQKFENIGF